MQKPIFRRLGCDLDKYYSGTINLSIAPFIFRVKEARYRFCNLRWMKSVAAEDFEFMDCRVIVEEGKKLDGLIYYHNPETKPEHFQAPDILEILNYPIDRLAYGDRLTVEVDKKQIEILKTNLPR